jgi:hypothetical protein
MASHCRRSRRSEGFAPERSTSHGQRHVPAVPVDADFLPSHLALVKLPIERPVHSHRRIAAFASNGPHPQRIAQIAAAMDCASTASKRGHPPRESEPA